MKKLLLASTALVLSAGVASAQGVSLSGDARMGLVYDGSDVMMTSRARVTFTLSGETDTGLAFGGSFRADNASGAAAGTAGSVYISGQFGKLSMGDVAGAARAATGDLYGVGLTGLGDMNEMAYLDRLNNGIDATVCMIAGCPTGFAVQTGLSIRPRALYEYSIDGFTFYASVGNTSSERVSFSQSGVPLGSVTISNASGGDFSKISLREFAVGAAYSIDQFTVAAGYEDVRFRASGGTEPNESFSANHVTLSAEFDADVVSVKAFIGRAGGDLGTALADDSDSSRTQYGLSVKGTFDATSVSAFAKRGFDKTTMYGIGAAYDLGGGAKLQGGIAKAQGSKATADFGLAFSF